MKLRVLVDNNTYIDQYYLGEPAVSFFVTYGDKRILFDTGYSDAFIQNARKMDIDLSKVTHIVLSHGHNDHTNGLRYLADSLDLSKIQLVAHPDCFREKESEGLYIGAPSEAVKMSKSEAYREARAPYQITEGCIFLGEIPRRNSFEAKVPIGGQKVSGVWEDDYVMEDSALVCKTKEGLFIITGCSHSGICNIIDYAMEVCGDTRIAGVLGGFHLLKLDERAKQTAAYLKERQIRDLYPCHCVSLEVKARMMQELNVKEVGVGLEIEMED